MMKKNEKKEDTLKKEYLPPNVTIDLIEMEYGIAANSVITVPVGTGTEVKTDWEGEDNSTIIAPY
ncbi:hypothetical protein AB2S32_13730 [Elizabethkingia anophelis]|uniref:Uncharacterized protein n=1 Tax=Elizabethkingia anophelis R26 TaxID=1246994 RepID=A0ABN5BUH7_9FLAO|nr:MULTISPECIES: hypothetical protein [Elizabethkingia]ATC34732.1 hypothetical protein BAZ09_000370 [Elizabethkingia anophelis R26]ATC38373.1 hypothetical protein EAAG1_000370 [Elizabethkingia anophelis Ag1]ATC42054.1 hypothetical protein CMV41_00370 [Elizabethkingia anophelis]ATC45730.1 hypothetical protein CMV40_00370 [Elizabethkingia anophelis]ELR78312.1 hypothetical protein D505_16668 [Elizabethkingia anophelis R26]